MTRRATALLTAALALSAATPATAAVKKAPSPQRQVATAFKQLAQDTRALPRKAASSKTKARLLRTVAAAKRSSRRNPCRAITTLASYRRSLRGIREARVKGRRPSPSSRRGALAADALKANVALAQLPKAKRCGGGRRSTVAQADPKVLASDARSLRLRVALPPPSFVTHKAGGTAYAQMLMDGMGETGDVGKPGLPRSSSFFGVPEGANVSLKINATQGYDLHGVELYPHQKSSADLKPLPKGAPPTSTFADPTFARDARTYGSGAKFPAHPADTGDLGDVRGLRVGGVDVAGGQYNPRSNTLHVFTTIDLTVNFGGDNKGTFGAADDFTGPWESYFSRNYGTFVDNYRAILDHLGVGPVRPFCGEDMLVVTSGANRPAANSFAAAKQVQGYRTRVVETGAGAGQIGTTPGAVQTYIRGELTALCKVRPQYVVLLGNTDAVPTFLVPCGPGGDVADCNIASDLPYSLNGSGSDLFADVMLGRIPATDPTNAQAVVDKIINYENSPPAPSGDDFYSHATVTGYFQPATICVLNAGATGAPNCNPDAGAVNAHVEIDYSNHQDTRGFTKTSDSILRAMRAQSYSVDRLWTTDDTTVRPEKYYDGTDIPTALRRPAFAWNADTPDFLSAYNAGRFLILHRDHGWPDGWAAPQLWSADIPSLTNGTKLPVVFGINCASGAFDNPANPSFVEEQIEKVGGGAVAGFGDTRNSPSFPNNHMALGFFDALFPDLVPAFGSSVPTRRLGPVLLSGKSYMASQEGIDWQGAGDTYVEHYLYHLLGDPSMQMWAAPPKRFDPSTIFTRYVAVERVDPGDPGYRIHVQFPTGGGEPPAFGTVATLYHAGDAIGRGVVGADGQVTIAPETATDAKDLTVAFQQDGVLPAQDGVDDTPAPGPQATTLTLQAPSRVGYTQGTVNTFTGHLDPGFAGAPIRVVYTRDKPVETMTGTATTTATGDYSTDATFNANQGGPWHAQAFFDADAAHSASSSPSVAFTVTR